MNQRCKVCEEPAAGFHFGAFTCEGCKSFFGRAHSNPVAAAAVECKTGAGRCVIDKHSRTSCKACRLKKCLAAGMSKSGSRYGRRSNWFKIHCLLQQQRRRRRLITRCDGRRCDGRRDDDDDDDDGTDGCDADRTPPPLPVMTVPCRPLAAMAMAMPFFGFAPWDAAAAAVPLPRSERSAFGEPSRGGGSTPPRDRSPDPDNDGDRPVDLTVVARPTTTVDHGDRDDDGTKRHRRVEPPAAGYYYYYDRYYDCCGPLDLTGGGGRNFGGIRS